MEESLFRAKRADNGELIEGVLAYFFDNKENTMIMPSCYFGTRDFGDEDENENPIISEHIALGGFISVIPETVCRYTGREIKGVKIFSGDQINCCGLIYTVFWSDEYSAFMAEYKHPDDSEVTYLGDLLSGKTDLYEVI